ncbi:MAG: nucleoside hydrolase [Kiritimatiellia bacterium]
MSLIAPSMKVLLDTDIGYGTDADDALALAYLLLRPDCELLGITTVGLHSEWRAGLAALMCEQAGKPGIPVAAGADNPLFPNVYWRINPVREKGNDPAPVPSEYSPNRALDLIKKLVDRYPGEITLITIGQFTNLAVLLTAYPETAAALKSVVSMGGRLQYERNRPETECNVMLDPVAAAVVFERTRVSFTLLPIDAARGKGLDADGLRLVLNAAGLPALADACSAWKDTCRKPGLGLADPFTCQAAFEPGLAATERGKLGIRLYDHEIPGGQPFENGEVTGATRFEEEPGGPHLAVKSINADEAHSRLFEVFEA